MYQSVHTSSSLYYRASYYELSSNGDSSERQKSSGVLVYTGTGSTSWYALDIVKPGPIKAQHAFVVAVIVMSMHSGLTTLTNLWRTM